MKRILVLLVLILLSSGMVCAHRVHVSARVGEITVKSWFGGGEPIRDGNVTVYILEEGGEELYLEGSTDGEGEYSFPHKIGVKNYRIEVESTHMPGHKAETLVNMSSMQSGLADTGVDVESPPYQGIIAGIGYLLGLAGIAMSYIAWKKNA